MPSEAMKMQREAIEALKERQREYEDALRAATGSKDPDVHRALQDRLRQIEDANRQLADANRHAAESKPSLWRRWFRGA